VLYSKQLLLQQIYLKRVLSESENLLLSSRVSAAA